MCKKEHQAGSTCRNWLVRPGTQRHATPRAPTPKLQPSSRLLPLSSRPAQVPSSPATKPAVHLRSERTTAQTAVHTDGWSLSGMWRNAVLDIFTAAVSERWRFPRIVMCQELYNYAHGVVKSQDSEFIYSYLLVRSHAPATYRCTAATLCRL